MAAVRWALECAGIPTVCYEGFGWEQSRQAHVVTDPEFAVNLGEQTVRGQDTVWIRRIQQPSMHPGLHPADRKFVAGENQAFQRALFLVLQESGARCINPWSAGRLIDNKPRQLALARRCGLEVPATIFGNDRSAITKFVRQGGPVVFKSFYPHAWQIGKTRLSAIAAAFDITEGVADWVDLIDYSPGIYQRRVDKIFDVRLHILGRELLAFSIEAPANTVDWRPELLLGRIKVSPVRIPCIVRQSVLAFAAAAQIEFGVCDFAVDKLGTWWFLEINEQGQFLGIQHMLPGTTLFQQFLSLLAPTHPPPEAFPALADFPEPDAEFGVPAPRFETEE